MSKKITKLASFSVKKKFEMLSLVDDILDTLKAVKTRDFIKSFWLEARIYSTEKLKHCER